MNRQSLSSHEIENTDLRAALDAVVLRNLSPVSAGLGVLYVIFGVSHLLVLPGDVTVPMSIAAAGTAVVILGFYVALRWWAPPARWAHPIGAGIAALALFNSLLHLHLTSEPQQSTNLMLLIAGIGFLFLSPRWLALVLAATLAGWGIVVWASPPSPAWLHFGFGMLTATLLSVLVHTVRVRTLQRLEGLRLQDERRKAELDSALRAARHSESRYRDLLEEANDLIQSIAPDGSILYVNRAWRETLGFGQEEIAGLSIFDVIHPDSREHCRAVLERLTTAECSERLETTLLTKGGEAIAVEGSINCQFEDGLPVATRGILRDVTERKRAEQSLQRRNRELVARNTVAQALSTSLELHDLLDKVLSSATESLGFTGGLVSLSDERTGRLALSAHTGLPPALIEQLQSCGLEGTLCDLVYQRDEPLGLEDLGERAPLEVDGLLQMGLRSYAGAPIRHKDRALGTFCLFDSAPRPISEADHAMLTAIGQQIGVAVENARLFESAVREREIAQTLLNTTEALSTTLQLDRLIEHVLDELQRVVPYDVASICLLHDGHCQLAASRSPAHAPSFEQDFALKEHPLARRAAGERRAVVVSDARDMPDWPTDGELPPPRSWLAAPLIARDEVIGVLTLGSNRPDLYDDDAARLASAFARHAALAVENSRLYGQAMAQLREMTVLQNVTAAISSTLDIDLILPYVARSLCEILNSTSVEIYGLDEKNNVAALLAAYAVPAATGEEKSQSEPGRIESLAALPATAEALAQRRPLQTRADDPAAEPGERDRLKAHGALSVLLLPMVTHDHVLGFVRIWDSSIPRQFTAGEIATGQTLAHQAAVAVESARLLTETQAALAETKALYRASSSLIAQESLSNVLQTVVDGVVEALPADRATLITLDLEKRRLTNFVKGGPGAERALPISFAELWEGLSGWVLRELKPALSPKGTPDPRESPQVQQRRRETECGSIIAVPLLYRGKTLGTMTAINRPDERDFTQQDVELMMALANHAAAALENARLFEEIQRRATHLAAAAEVARNTAATLGVTQLLEETVRLISEQFGFYHASVFLMDDEENELYVTAATDSFWEIIPEGYRQPVGRGAIGMAAQTGETVRVADASDDPVPYRVGRWLSPSSLSVPIRFGERVTGVLEVEADIPHAFDENDQTALELIADQIAVAIQEARLFEEIEERRLYLEGVLGAAPDAVVTLDARHRIIEWNAGAEWLFGYSREEVVGKDLDPLITTPSTLAEAVGFTGRAMGGEELPPMEAVRYRKDGSPVDVILAGSPILVGDEYVGAVAVYTDITERKRAERMLKEYSERLEEMVEERTRELREAQGKLLAQQRLQQELEMAAGVQASLLPDQVPSLDGFEIAAAALPARHVSGDLYDFVVSDSEACHIVLADISGKGIPAALLASTARALLRTETERSDSPAVILSTLNRLLHRDLEHAEMFITLIAARLDVRSGVLTYASAGHTETLWWRQGSRDCHTLPSTGLPIGIFAETSIAEEFVRLRPGDVLLFYSDGITEAANPRHERFGMERFTALLTDHADSPASELCETIVEAAETFRAAAPRSDDLTLVVLRALPRTVSFSYPARLDHLSEARELVRQAASVYGDDFASQMKLAASEIIANVIRHAYGSSSGEMRGEISLLPDQIQLDLYDQGASFDPAALPEPDLGELQEGGYGIHIVRQLTDELSYTPGTSAGNRWRLVKRATG